MRTVRTEASATRSAVASAAHPQSAGSGVAANRSGEELEMTKIIRRFMGLAILLACGLGTPEGMAWAGAPKAVIRTLPDGSMEIPDTKHVCPKGDFLFVYANGSFICRAFEPPRSPADCPPGAKYVVIKGLPVCNPLNQQLHALPAGDTGPASPPCKSDADCPRGGVCYPMGGGMCGSPPISR